MATITEYYQTMYGDVDISFFFHLEMEMLGIDHHVLCDVLTIWMLFLGLADRPLGPS